MHNWTAAQNKFVAFIFSLISTEKQDMQEEFLKSHNVSIILQVWIHVLKEKEN